MLQNDHILPRVMSFPVRVFGFAGLQLPVIEASDSSSGICHNLAVPGPPCIEMHIYEYIYIYTYVFYAYINGQKRQHIARKATILYV